MANENDFLNSLDDFDKELESTIQKANDEIKHATKRLTWKDSLIDDEVLATLDDDVVRSLLTEDEYLEFKRNTISVYDELNINSPDEKPDSYVDLSSIWGDLNENDIINESENENELIDEDSSPIKDETSVDDLVNDDQVGNLDADLVNELTTKLESYDDQDTKPIDLSKLTPIVKDDELPFYKNKWIIGSCIVILFIIALYLILK